MLPRYHLRLGGMNAVPLRTLVTEGAVRLVAGRSGMGAGDTAR